MTGSNYYVIIPTMDYIKELFECNCGCLRHTICLSSFPPFEEEDDKVVYGTVLISQWRNCIFPSSFFIKDLFVAEDQKWTPLSLEYWKEYYYGSIWSRIPIALKHIFKSSNEEGGIFSSTIIGNKNTEKMDHIMSVITDEIISCELVEISSDDYMYQFSIDKIDEIDKDTEWFLYINSQFLKKGFFKRLLRATKYIFGFNNSRYGDEDCFEITPETASKIRGIIQAIRNHNNELNKNNEAEKEKNNDEASKEARGDST